MRHPAYRISCISNAAPHSCLRRVSLGRQLIARSHSIHIDAGSSYCKGITLRYRGDRFLRGQNCVTTQAGQTEQFVTLFSSVGALAQHQNFIDRQTIALLRSTCERPERYASARVEHAGLGGEEPGLFLPTSHETSTHKVTMRLCQIAHYPIGKSRILNELGQPVRQQNRKGIARQLALFDLLHSAVWRVGFGLPAVLDEQGFRYGLTPHELGPEGHNKLCAMAEAGEYTVDHNGHLAIGGLLLETESFANISIAPSPDSPFPSKLLVKRKSEPDFVHPSGVIVSMNRAPIEQTHAIGLLKLLKIARVGWYNLDQPCREILLSGLFTENSDLTQTLMTQNHSLNAIAPIFTALERLTGFSMKRSLDLYVKKTGERILSAVRNQDELKEAFLCGDILNEMVQPLRCDGNGLQAEWPERLKRRFADNNNGTRAIAYAFDLHDRTGRSLLQEESCLPAQLPSIDEPIRAKLISPDLYDPKNIAAILSTGILVAEQYLLEQVLTKASRGDEQARQTLATLLDDSIATEAVTHARHILESTSDPAAPLLGRQFCHCDGLTTLFRDALNTRCLIQYIERLYTVGFADPGVDVAAALSVLHSVGDKIVDLMRFSSPEIGGRGISAGMSLIHRHLRRPAY